MDSTIVSVEQLKLLTSISDTMDVTLLQPHLLISQQMNVEPILGTALYDDIINRWDNNTLTGNTQTLYEEYIVPAIAYGAWASSVPFLAYKTQRSGIQTQTSPDNTAVTSEELSLYMARVDNMKTYYCNRLNDYLIKDNGEIFPLFRVNNVIERNSVPGGIYLNYGRNRACNSGDNINY